MKRSRISLLKLKNTSTVTLIAIGLLALAACKSTKDQIPAEVRPISISILHDNDLALSGWLESAVAPFLAEIAPTYPGNRIELSQVEESTSSAIENLATGRLKVDAVILPHFGFSEIINDKLVNLGAAISSCQELIGNPYVAVIPANQVDRLSGLLARPLAALTDKSVPVSLKELGILMNLSSYGYINPRRSTRGQFGLLLSIAAIAPEYYEGQAPWASTLERIKEAQKHMEWYASSDTQLLKKIASQTSTSTTASEKLDLALISLRQLHLRSEFKDSVVILRPSDGSIWEKNSLCLSTADWVSPVKKSILVKLQNFLASPLMIEKAKDLGFEAVGKNSKVSPDSIALLNARKELSAETVNSLQKPFALAFAIDTSSSMPAAILSQIREFSIGLLSDSPPSARLDYLSFSSELQVLGSREALQSSNGNRFPELTPSGGSSIYDAIARQYELLPETPLSSHRRVALVITDGNDKNSVRSIEELIDFIKNTNRTKGFISLHMVVLSPDQADLLPLKKIVEAANGTLYETGTEGLPGLLTEIQQSL